MSDYADEMDARGQDHDLTTGDPTAWDAITGEPIEGSILEHVLRDELRDVETDPGYGDYRDDLF